MNRVAVLFDLDDTLIDYSGRVAACWDAACTRVVDAGVDPQVVAAAVHEVRAWFWADPARHARERVDMLGAWTKITAIALARVGAPSAVLARAVATDFATRRMLATTLFDDALPCLRRLRARGVALGLVTNGDVRLQREKLARHGLDDRFDAVVIDGEFGVGKPDPAVYRHVIARLGVEAACATMVGDNVEWDVLGAERAGVTGVWLDRGGAGLPAGHPPVRTIRTLADLLPD